MNKPAPAHPFHPWPPKERMRRSNGGCVANPCNAEDDAGGAYKGFKIPTSIRFGNHGRP